jgi:hypothetical protein
MEGERTKMVYAFPTNEVLWAKYVEIRAEGLRAERGLCFKIERERARDFKDYHEKSLFRAEVSTHWRKVGGDDE